MTVDTASTSAAEPVDLPVLIRRTAADHPDEPAPATIADIVMAQIPVGQERALLKALLPRYVGDVLRRAEQTPATDPRAVWGDLLTDRVPTEAGYRFLRDCTSDDIREGAIRRRTHAESLVRRAELYDAIARRIETGAVPSGPVSAPPGARDTTPTQQAPVPAPASHIANEPQSPKPEPMGPQSTQASTPGELPQADGVALVMRARGYVGPSGRSMRDLPSGLRPSIGEILDELSMIPLDVLVGQFLEDDELLEKVVLADARGWTTPQMRAVLESDQLAEWTYEALVRVNANLVMAVAGQREARNEKRRKQIGKDHHGVQQRQAVLGRIVRENAKGPKPDPVQQPEKEKASAVIREHRTEYEQEMAARLTAAGLPVKPPLSLPPKERSGSWAVENHVITLTPEGAAAWAMTDHEFDRLVRTDINGAAVSALREPGVCERWQRMLKQIADQHLALAEPDDTSLKVRRRRFHAALMQRQGEVRRTFMTAHKQVVAAVRAVNSEDDRDRVRAEVRALMVQRYVDTSQ